MNKFLKLTTADGRKMLIAVNHVSVIVEPKKEGREYIEGSEAVIFLANDPPEAAPISVRETFQQICNEIG